MDFKYAFQDAQMDINAGLGGLHSIMLRIGGGPAEVLTPQQLMQKCYPCLKGGPLAEATSSSTASSSDQGSKADNGGPG